MPSEAVLTIARTIRANLAGSALSPLQAKLYSQRIRRDMGADGLTSFSPAELTARLDEACLLLEAGWLERSADESRAWTQAVKRAAEVLEWISHAALKPPEAPIHLLSAAAYQVAGYPAMALGHLRTMPAGEAFSKILREFLRGDFDASLSGVQEFWKTQHDLEADHVLRVATAADSDGEEGLVDLEVSTVRHVIMCIGTICSYLRTGETALVDRALTKLDALARSYLHSRDPYSYLLARLSAGAAHRFVDASLWPHIGRLADEANLRTRAALTQFARAAFVNRRALVWPAQREGIDRLAANDSFVLCTPTGSGKTTIATLGAVQGLFVPRPDPALPENLVLYLVPSRALAAEVETRFAEDLRGIAAEPIVVTGLYGGADWGPTDAWVQIDQPTVVICTFEKADALLRYLGTLFLDRVRLSSKLGRMRKPFADWEKLLRWWLFKISLKKQPKPKELGPWFAFVADNFIYRGNWGLGSLVGVLMDQGDAAGPVDALTMDDWPRSSLPWIGFWLKELVNWGTLDPVAAFLLARGNARDRAQAEADAADYYAQLGDETDANDKLDPRRIRDWVEARRASAPPRPTSRDITLDIRLERPARDYLVRRLSVLPLVSGEALRWIDPAGYAVASCDRPADWDDLPTRYRFELSVNRRQVTGEAYLPHRHDPP